MGNLTDARAFDVSSNQLSGEIPPELGRLTQLENLFLRFNQLTGGIPPELGALIHVQAFLLDHNQLTGSIPPELSNLVNVYNLWLHDNQLTGSIPPELGNIATLNALLLYNNQLSGSIPSKLGNLSNLQYLQLSRNKLSGSIPPELGNLVNLIRLYIDNNALAGDVPNTITQLPQLASTEIGYNQLTASDPAVVAFLNGQDSDWATTQTIPPTEVAITSISPTQVKLTWTPIAYSGDGGGYRVYRSTTTNGPYELAGETLNKSSTEYLVGNLTPNTTYYFVIRTYTPAHGDQKNSLLSRNSTQVSTRTLGPASIQVIPGMVDTGLASGTIASGTLMISNVGQLNLDYEILKSYSDVITDVIWLSVSPMTATVPPGDIQKIDLLFDATRPGVSEVGVYTATLFIRSNDPFAPQVNVPVTMTIAQPIDAMFAIFLPIIHK